MVHSTFLTIFYFVIYKTPYPPSFFFQIVSALVMRYDTTPMRIMRLTFMRSAGNAQ